jgi:uncharacterized membrane protein YgcG
MRAVRLVGVVLTVLTAGSLLTSPAGAQPPSKLADHITDNTGALTDSGRAAVSSAIDRLYRDRHIQLWVVYVDNFSNFKPENWAERTRTATGMGGNDALLAVATNTKRYAFTVPPTVPGLTEDEVDSLRAKQIEPAVGKKDWSGAAVVAADGLDKTATSSKQVWPLIAIGVGVVVLVVVVVVLALYLARRRRRALPIEPSGEHGGAQTLEQALSIADGRLRQVSDYVARHGGSIGSQAKGRLEETKRYFEAARRTAASNEADAIAYANRASTLAAEAQTLANADVQAGKGKRRGRSTAATR